MACCTNDVRIEDLGNHPAELVLGLRDTLSTGAKIIADPKRRGFYEVQSDSLVYYIYVSPVSGNVLLLASWPNQTERERSAEA